MKHIPDAGDFHIAENMGMERAIGMITVAHPDFREGLFASAKVLGLIGSERKLGEAVHGVYPVNLEEALDIDGEEVVIRPAKPVDERRIQEHYYGLDKEDIFSRFRHEKTSFSRSDVEVRSHVDYVKDLTLLAVVGEFGFGRVVAVGECMLIEKINMAEVAFSVHNGRRLVQARDAGGEGPDADLFAGFPAPGGSEGPRNLLSPAPARSLFPRGPARGSIA